MNPFSSHHIPCLSIFFCVYFLPSIADVFNHSVKTSSTVNEDDIKTQNFTFVGKAVPTKDLNNQIKRWSVTPTLPTLETVEHKHIPHGNISHDNSNESSIDSSSEEDDPGDSDVSEERNPEDLINSDLSPVRLDFTEQKRPDDVISVINSAFSNRKSFSCPKIKTHISTGTSTSDLSPEDIGIMAAMGDALSTGYGLWPGTEIEFRGAAFPSGGDATIDGLVTVPNILREFTDVENLYGVSHGMGLRDQLPENQLNVAVSGTGSGDLIEQATELVTRLKGLKEIDVFNTWALIIITVGTEEICKNCTGPNTKILIETLDILNRGIHKALVVLLGPIHVSSQYHQKANLLKDRCECSKEKSNEFMVRLSTQWSEAFEKVQLHVEDSRRKTFNVLALPMLTITSRYPYSLFIPRKPLLNRRGHTYAAKWLWNRLISGPKYNLSKAILSQDAYFCPSLGCPYFRTTDNQNLCTIVTHTEAILEKEREENIRKNSFGFERTKFNLYITSAVVSGISVLSVLIFATIFYQRSKKGTKGRFDQPYIVLTSVDKDKNKQNNDPRDSTTSASDGFTESPIT